MLVTEMTTVFQPIVDLTTRRPVAYEALSRLPSPMGPAFPAALFETAQAEGWIAELDEICWKATLRSAASVGLSRSYALFVNLEAESLRRGLFDAIPAGQRLVLEITERALLASPGQLLAMIDCARQAGHAIAIDDLGADPASLALLPLIEPDVIKVDMTIVQGHADAESARVMSAQNTFAATREVIIVAEGIETEEHLLTAQALGATHGQGWLFGRPSPDIPKARSATGLTVARDDRERSAPDATPFEVVARQLNGRTSGRRLLLQMSYFLEARAQASGNSAIILATFQDSTNLTGSTAARYSDLAQHCALVLTFTDGRAEPLDPRIKSYSIDEQDALNEEWDIVVLTADFAATLVAREADPTRYGAELYEFILTHDRSLSVAAARSLLRRTA